MNDQSTLDGLLSELERVRDINDEARAAKRRRDEFFATMSPAAVWAALPAGLVLAMLVDPPKVAGPWESWEIGRLASARFDADGCTVATVAQLPGDASWQARTPALRKILHGRHSTAEEAMQACDDALREAGYRWPPQPPTEPRGSVEPSEDP